MLQFIIMMPYTFQSHTINQADQTYFNKNTRQTMLYIKTASMASIIDGM